MKNRNESEISSLKFEVAVKELEAIIGKLESGETSITLEESVDLYKRGILLSQHCKEIIQKAEQEINVLTKKQSGELAEEPFGEKDEEI